MSYIDKARQNNASLPIRKRGIVPMGLKRTE